MFRFKYVNLKPLEKVAIFFSLLWFPGSYIGDKGQRFMFNRLTIKNLQLRVDLV